MDKYTVEQIKEEAKVSLRSLNGLRGKNYLVRQFKVGEIRNLAQKVLFLCREIEKLRKKIKNV